jgi:hypothetical protein
MSFSGHHIHHTARVFPSEREIVVDKDDNGLCTANLQPQFIVLVKHVRDLLAGNSTYRFCLHNKLEGAISFIYVDTQPLTHLLNLLCIRQTQNQKAFAFAAVQSPNLFQYPAREKEKAEFQPRQASTGEILVFYNASHLICTDASHWQIIYKAFCIRKWLVHGRIRVMLRQ